MNSLEAFVDGLRNYIAEKTERFIGEILTEEVVDEIYEELAVDEIVFYDNYGNSTYNDKLENFIRNRKLKIVGRGHIVEEYHNLVYHSDINRIYVDIPCKVIEDN
ncbi:MAG: hypothetical protein ACOC1K_05340 [Nanoarchaeota archaeon]